MRHQLIRLSLMLSGVFLVSCVSAIPPARIGDYVSPEQRAGDDAFARIYQRALQAGLVVRRSQASHFLRYGSLGPPADPISRV